ncbi:MAG: DEAD/DEAH box helicase [Candidatus Micrarchaeota archaeon]|nr:DEAD/DEAH box helicase [Candidatus Micrarchaeota archaeon]
MAVDARWQGLGEVAGMLNLDGIEYREYQFNIIRSIEEHGNTLVVIPTGLGKTFIGTVVLAKAIKNGKRALLLAPTKPLAEQHFSALSKILAIEPEKLMLLTGSIGKEKRREQEAKASVIVATPQTITNDLKRGGISLDSFGAVVFDECHRAVGKYAYTYIANECSIRDILMVGLTASPGGNKKKINEVVRTLDLEYIEARVSTDEDVVPYIMPKYVHVVEVDLSQRIKEIANALRPEIEENVLGLNKLGLLSFYKFENIPKGRLIQIGDQISRLKAEGYKYAALFSYTKLLNLIHAYDLLTTEGIYPFHMYVESLYARENKSRSVESLLKSNAMLAARRMATEAVKNGEEHPKALAVLDILKDYREKNSIIFAQYRSTIRILVEILNNNGFLARPFIGKNQGVTQEQQKRTIDDFRNGVFKVLVASSIGEEGIDIPGVDLVLFYEPVPNEIRNIQRRGRTGRFESGDVYILAAKETKDIVYLRVSKQREAKMLALIKEINSKLGSSQHSEGQTQLQ